MIIETNELVISEELEEKLKTSKPTRSGKEVKIAKDTYDTLNHLYECIKTINKGNTK